VGRLLGHHVDRDAAAEGGGELAVRPAAAPAVPVPVTDDVSDAPLEDIQVVMDDLADHLAEPGRVVGLPAPEIGLLLGGEILADVAGRIVHLVAQGAAQVRLDLLAPAGPEIRGIFHRPRQVRLHPPSMCRDMIADFSVRPKGFRPTPGAAAGGSRVNIGVRGFDFQFIIIWTGRARLEGLCTSGSRFWC